METTPATTSSALSTTTTDLPADQAVVAAIDQAIVRRCEEGPAADQEPILVMVASPKTRDMFDIVKQDFTTIDKIALPLAALQGAEERFKEVPLVDQSGELFNALVKSAKRDLTVLIAKPETFSLLQWDGEQEYTTLDRYLGLITAVWKKQDSSSSSSSQKRKGETMGAAAAAAQPPAKVMKSRQEDISTQRSTELLREMVTCPVCWDLPELGKPIFGCHHGHHWCNTCHQKSNLKKCPICRTPHNEAIRVLVIEKILTDILPPTTTECSYCTQSFPRQEMFEHMKFCCMRPVSCLHPKCNFVGSFPALHQHLQGTTKCATINTDKQNKTMGGMPKFSGNFIMYRPWVEGVKVEYYPMWLAFRDQAHTLGIHAKFTLLEDGRIRLFFKSCVDYDLGNTWAFINITEAGNGQTRVMKPLKIHRWGVVPWDLKEKSEILYLPQGEYQSWSKSTAHPERLFSWEVIVQIGAELNDKLMHLKVMPFYR